MHYIRIIMLVFQEDITGVTRIEGEIVTVM